MTKKRARLAAFAATGNPQARTRCKRRTLVVLTAVLAQMSAMKAHAVTDDHWTNSAGGTWDVDSNWSLNAAPTTPDYNALVDLQIGSPYEVDIVDDFSVAGITLNSSDATIVQSGGTVSTPTLNVDAGAYQLNGGTISGAAININGGSFIVQNGTFDGVTLSGGDVNVPVGATLTVLDNLTGDGHAINLGTDPYDGATLIFDGPSQTVDNLSINTTGSTIYVGGPNSGGPATLTLGTNGIIHGGAYIDDYSGSSTLINNGTLSADSSGQFLNVNTSYFINNATAQAINGDSLLINSGTWSNSSTGVISANGGEADLSGNWTNAGTISATNGGTLGLSGTWTNNGTISATGGSVLSIAGDWTNDGMISASGMGTLNLGGTFTFGKLSTFSLSSDTTVNLTGTLDNTNSTFTFPSNWNLAGGTILNGTLSIPSDQPLNVVQNGTLDGVTLSGGDVDVAGGTSLYVLHGLTGDGHAINLNASDQFGGASLFFDGPDQTIDDVSINANTYPYGCDIYVGGYTTTDPVTLTLGPSAIVHGGSLLMQDYSQPSTLINEGTISADASGQSITIATSNFINSGTAQAINGGNLQINVGSWSNSSTGIISANASEADLSGNWTNAGMISATSGGTLGLSGTWTNSGTISASDGSTINLGGNFSTAGIGTLSASSDGTINIDGSLDNSNGTLMLSGYGGSLVLNGGTISGGTVDVGSANFSTSGGTLDGVSVVNGDLNFVGNYSGSVLTIENGLTIQSGYQLNLSSTYYGTTLVFDGSSQTLVDNITINGTSSSQYGQQQNINISGPNSGGPSTLTLGTSGVIEGAININDGSYPSTLVNSGIINANGQSLTISTSSFINNGTTEATLGGQLSINSGSWSNAGTLSADGNSQLTLNGTWTNSGTIVLTNGSTANLNGTFTTAGIGMLSASSDSTININGSLDNSNGTLMLSGYGGSLVLNGGTISGGTIDVGSANFSTSGGTLDEVSVVNGDLNFVGNYYGSVLTIEKGLTIQSGHQLNVSSTYYGVNLVFDGSSQTLDNATISSAPSSVYGVDQNMSIGGPNSTGPTTLTLGTHGAIVGAIDIGDGSFSSTLVNGGTINANLSGKTLNINTSNFINNGLAEATTDGILAINSPNWSNTGTLSADGNSQLTLGGNWTNSGTIVLTNGSTANLNGTFTNAAIGTISASSDSVININGSLDNNGATLSLAGNGGSLVLNGGTISGGTIDVGSANFSTSGGTLDGVSVVNGDLNFVGNYYGSVLTIEHGLTMESGHQLNISSTYYGANLVFDGSSQTVDNITISGTNSSTYGVAQMLSIGGPNSTGATTLTLGTSGVIEGAIDIGDGSFSSTLVNTGTIDANISGETLTISPTNFINNGLAEATNGGDLSIASSTFTNNGTLLASGGGVLDISSSNWSNSGTISATGGSTISLGGNFTSTGMGTLSADSNSAIQITGNLDNTGQTLFLLGQGTLSLNTNGTIKGGTVNVGSTNFAVEGGTLNGVNIAGGDLQVSTSLYVLNGITIANHNLDLSDGSRVYFDGPSQSVDSLNITTPGSAIVYSSGPNSGGSQTLTLGSGVTVHGGINFNNYNTGDGLINNGTFEADTNSIAINLDNFTNNGLAEATSGQTLTIGALNFTNTGTLSAQSGSTVNIQSNITAGALGYYTTNGGAGTVELSGTLQNAGQTTTLSDILTLNGGTISGGTITTSSNGQLAAGGSGGTLDNVSLASDQTLNNTRFNVVDGLGVYGSTISLGDSSFLIFNSNQSQAVNGNGTFLINASNSGLVDYNGTLTIGRGINVVGAYAGSSSPVSGYSTVVNNGTFTALSGDNFYISVGTFTNDGTLSAQSGGTITIASTVTPGGLGYFTTNGGTGTVIFAGTLENAGATTTINDTLILTGEISGGTLALGTNGQVVIGNSGGYYNTATLDDVTVTGNLTLTQGERLYVQDNLTLANATITASDLQYGDGGIVAVGSQSILGNGTIILGAQTNYNAAAVFGSNGTLTIGSGINIVAQLGGYVGDTDVVNNGKLTAESGAFLFIESPSYYSPSTFFNNGTLDAEPGGTIGIACTIAPGQLGYFNTNGGAGTVELEANGILQNANTNTVLTDILTLNGGTISGGTLSTTGAGSLLAGTNGGTLSGVTLAANFRIPDGVHITGGLTIDKDTLALASGALSIDNTGPLTLTGTGAITQSGTSTALIASPLVIAPVGGDTAAYTLAAGTLTAQKSLLVGENGAGSFTQTGGTTHVTGAFGGGNNGGLTGGTGSAIINIGGTSQFYADTVLLGSTTGGTADMTVSGTANVTVGGGAHLNDLNVSGGTFTVLNQTPPAGEDPELNRAIVGGYLTNGALNVSGTGVVSSPMLKLGVTEGETGTLTQSGGSITLSTLSVGNDGTLTSGSGTGVANVSGGALYADTVLLGSTAGGSGAMTVSGSANVTVGGGAHLNDLNVSGGTFTVLNQAPPAGEDPELNRAIVGGYLTNGALNVSGTGVVSAPLLKLGITSGETGTLTESGGSITLSTLSVGNDGTLTSGSGTGVANVSGGSLYADTVLLGSTAGGSGAMTVSGTANVTVGGGAHLNDLNVNGGSFTVLNEASPAGEDPELDRAIVGGYLTSGALNVGSTGFVSSPYIKLGISSGFTGTFNQSAGTVAVGTFCVGNDITTTSGSGIGQATVSGGSLTIGRLLVGSSAGGVGTVNVSGTANVDVTSAITLMSGSTFHMTAGALSVDGGAVSLPSGNITIGDGTSSAQLHLHNASVAGSGSGLTIAQNATFDGGSDGGSENVGSALFSSSSLTLGGSTTVLRMALGGDPTNAANAGVTFDQVSMSGGVFTVGGATLELLPLSNAIVGVPYPIVVASSGGSINYSSVFSNLTTDPQYSGMADYSVSYSANAIDVTITATPEPGSAGLLAIGGMMLLRRRRRHPR